MTLREFDRTEWTLRELLEFVSENRIDTSECDTVKNLYTPDDYFTVVENNIRDMLCFNYWYDVRDYLNGLDIEGYDIIYEPEDEEPYGFNFGDENDYLLQDCITEVRNQAIDEDVFDEEDIDYEDDDDDDEDEENGRYVNAWTPMLGYTAPAESDYEKYAKQEIDESNTKKDNNDGTDFYELMSLVKSELEFQTLKVDTQAVTSLYDAE